MPIQSGGKFKPDPNIVSPGVFTRELDQSALAQGVANIGGAIVAPFPKGPAFSPTLVTDQTTLQTLFGVADGVYYGPYTAQQYLAEQGQVTICRVGALTGYKQNNPYLIYARSGSWDRISLDLDVEPGTPAAATGYELSFVLSPDGSTSNPTEGIVTYNSSGSGNVYINGQISVYLNHDSSSFVSSSNGVENYADYAGKDFLFGTITLPITASSHYITSSIQGSGASDDAKLLQALNESQLTSSNFSASYAGPIAITPATAFYGCNISLVNPTFTALRSAGGCGAVLYITSGTISGSYGDYTGNFTTASISFGDPCNLPGQGSSNFKVLAVLANTQHEDQAADLSLPGFSGSILTPTVPTGSGSSSVFNTGYSLLLKDNTNNVTYGNYNFSVDSTKNNYITSVFGNDATAGGQPVARGQKVEAAYLYNIFNNTIDAIVAEPWAWQVVGGTSIPGLAQLGDTLNFTDAYSLNTTSGDSAFAIREAETPWINSQGISPWSGDISGSSTPTKYKLFKVHTLGDGTGDNTRYKIEISNVKLAGTVPGSTYGSFTVSVRDYSDTDKRPIYLETFQNCNLDPSSANYVARLIGDKYNFITFAGKVVEFGTFTNQSKFIRIEMTDIVYPEICVPYGFDPYVTPIDSNYGAFIPTMKYSKASTYDVQHGKYPSGVVFGDVPVGASEELIALYPTSSLDIGVSGDTKQYFAPLPAFGSNLSTGANVAFDLETDYADGGVVVGSIVPSYVTADESTNVLKRKFVLGFQAGFDGQWPGIPINVGSNILAGNTQGLDCTNIKSAGSVAYSQCIGALGNADEWDINLIVTPGIFSSLHSYVVNLVVDMCETRGDCFYIMDNVVFPASNQSVGLIDAAVNEAAKFDTNYAATYYPWIKILDTNTNKIISVPPSVVLPAVYAANDQVAAEWFAPAGLNRGGITNAVQLLDRTTHLERDTLYDGRVNPIAAFPGTGISVWGQKTLQVKASALDRINVRRLLIALKKYIASASKYLVFEQNVSATRNQFLSIVNPYLSGVQQRSGLYAFKVVMDETNNTPDIVDRNILYGQIYLQPAKTAEFIVLDFNVMPTGATFPGA